MFHDSRQVDDCAFFARPLPKPKPAYGRVRSMPCASGYVPENAALHRAINLTVGLLLLVISMQFFVIIGLALLMTQGAQVFYAGERLGKGRKPFTIYKFRTLDARRAAHITPDRVLPQGSGIETPLGKYLRASRLDELPQILNVIRGDMALIGPRPVRPVIAALQEAANPHYAIRYTVMPGLIGHTQAYMCHGSSKRLRSKLNHMFCQSRVNYAADLGLLLRVGGEVLLKSARLMLANALPGHEERRARRLACCWHLDLETTSGQRLRVAAFYGDRLRLVSGQVQGAATLLLTTRSGGQRRVQIMTHQRSGQNDVSVVAANDYARHYLGRYLLNEPVVPPRPGPARPFEHSAPMGWSALPQHLQFLSATIRPALDPVLAQTTGRGMPHNRMMNPAASGVPSVYKLNQPGRTIKAHDRKAPDRNAPDRADTML